MSKTNRTSTKGVLFVFLFLQGLYGKCPRGRCAVMLQCLAYLRELNMASITVRLLCAMAFGGAVGIERGRKHGVYAIRPVGGADP